MTSADFSPFVVTDGFHTLFPTADEASLGTTRHFLSIYPVSYTHLKNVTMIVISNFMVSTFLYRQCQCPKKFIIFIISQTCCVTERRAIRHCVFIIILQRKSITRFCIFCHLLTKTLYNQYRNRRDKKPKKRKKIRNRNNSIQIFFLIHFTLYVRSPHFPFF